MQVLPHQLLLGGVQLRRLSGAAATSLLPSRTDLARPRLISPDLPRHQVCFDKAPRDESQAGQSAVKDSLADLLHEISTAVHDEEEVRSRPISWPHL